jgi:hypothetical protein
VLYPNGTGKTFDMAYYCNKRIPMAQALLASAWKGVSVEQGLRAERSARLHLIRGSAILSFESLDTFMSAFLPVVGQLKDDVPTYTNPHHSDQRRPAVNSWRRKPPDLAQESHCL